MARLSGNYKRKGNENTNEIRTNKGKILMGDMNFYICFGNAELK